MLLNAKKVDINILKLFLQGTDGVFSCNSSRKKTVLVGRNILWIPHLASQSYSTRTYLLTYTYKATTSSTSPLVHFFFFFTFAYNKEKVLLCIF